MNQAAASATSGETLISVNGVHKSYARGTQAIPVLQGISLDIARGAFLAHSEGVELSAKWQGAKGFFSGQGLVLLKAHGTGDLFFNSFGASVSVTLRGVVRRTSTTLARGWPDVQVGVTSSV